MNAKEKGNIALKALHSRLALKKLRPDFTEIKVSDDDFDFDTPPVTTSNPPVQSQKRRELIVSGKKENLKSEASILAALYKKVTGIASDENAQLMMDDLQNDLSMDDLIFLNSRFQQIETNIRTNFASKSGSNMELVLEYIKERVYDLRNKHEEIIKETAVKLPVRLADEKTKAQLLADTSRTNNEARQKKISDTLEAEKQDKKTSKQAELDNLISRRNGTRDRMEERDNIAEERQKRFDVFLDKVKNEKITHGAKTVNKYHVIKDPDGGEYKVSKYVKLLKIYVDNGVKTKEVNRFYIPTKRDVNASIERSEQSDDKIKGLQRHITALKEEDPSLIGSGINTFKLSRFAEIQKKKLKK